MSDIDPNAAEKLVESSVKLMNTSAGRIPAMRKVLAGLKEMGEDVAEQEANLNEVENDYKRVQNMLKRFPPTK